MVFCSSCGNNAGDNPVAKFCAVCGTLLPALPSSAANSVPPPAGPPPSRAQPVPPPPAPASSPRDEDPDNRDSAFDDLPDNPFDTADSAPLGPPPPLPKTVSASPRTATGMPPDRPEKPAVPARKQQPILESDYKAKLVAFYQQHNPAKLADMAALDTTLAAYRGNEAQLFADLEKKYGVGAASGPASMPPPAYGTPQLPPRAAPSASSSAAPTPSISARVDHPALKELPNIIDGLKVIYKNKIKPLEAMYKFHEFNSPLLTDADLDAKPMVMLLGQYSTGKTTFIQYLLEREFPGQRIGPEPTTDRFMAVMWGRDERIIPGNALAVQADKPFTALQKFGMAFLNKLEASSCPAPILEKISFIDTPGVLSGEKQRIGRSYDFPEVIEWFAERADRIILLFDAHKLDISDEFKSVIESVKGQEDKIRVILNKADMITGQQLMRVYGALMWSLGKVFSTPEVLRVYIGSFWDQPLRNTENKALFEAEMNDLLSDLRSLPRNNAVRKVNELVKRARMAKVHAYIISHLRNQFGWFGKDKMQKKLIGSLAEEFRKVQKQYNLPKGDFPNLRKFKERIEEYEIHKFPKLDELMIQQLDQVLGVDIPRLMRMLPGTAAGDTDEFKHGSVLNPFDDDNAALRSTNSRQWLIESATKTKYDNIFNSLKLSPDGKASGAVCREFFVARTGMAPATLREIWGLSDLDKDGFLDSAEFAVAMYLIDGVQTGTMTNLPPQLPYALVPPNKRHLVKYSS